MRIIAIESLQIGIRKFYSLIKTNKTFNSYKLKYK